VYEYAITFVPILVKECIEKAKVDIRDIKKILIHQANGKMDNVILQKTLRMFGLNKPPEHIMPMIISRLGNNSVATVPVLLDYVRKNKMENHRIGPGEHMVFASVGAGMNVNAIVYRNP